MTLPYLPVDTRMKTYKDRLVLEKMSNFEIKKHTGLPIELARDFVCELTPFMETRTNRGKAISAESQIITAMSFFRSGSFQYVEGTVGGISQSTVSRTLEKFATAIVQNMAKNFIIFPEEVGILNKLKEQFFELSNFPNIGGAVDGTHVLNKAPSIQENAYVNRKSLHSINTQIVCGPNNAILDAVVKWPGSAHDSFIWNNCALKSKFENGNFGETWLIGDSGYPVQHYLLTPYPHPKNRAQLRYNKSIRISRSIIERTLGIWKGRFRSMDKTGGTLGYSPQKCCTFILASLVLHNYFIFQNIALTVDEEIFVANFVMDDDITAPHGIIENQNGIATRDNLVQNYFDVNI